MNKKKAFIVSSIVASLSLVAGILYTNYNTSGNTSKADEAGYNLVWSDEFDGNSLNTANWTCETGTGSGGWGNNELEYYTDRNENVSVSNGSLKITAKKENYNGSNYTSARLKTKGKKSFKYGKIEAKIKVPQGNGLWPAFWMLGENIDTNEWPKCGEIDIMEHINTENKIYGTVHWDSNGHAEYGGNVATDPSAYHNYTIEWDENMIKWFLDGQKYHEIDIKDKSNTDEFHNNFFILLNLAVGGNWPGFTIDDGKIPASMEVDYVRVYQKGSAPLDSSNNNNTNNNNNQNQNNQNNNSWWNNFGDWSNWGNWGDWFKNNNNQNTNTQATDTQTTNTDSNVNASDNFKMEKTSDTTAKATVTNSSWVDIHYRINNGEQLNLRMKQNGTTATFDINGLKSGDEVKYWFTYSDTKNYTIDTKQYTYTHK